MSHKMAASVIYNNLWELAKEQSTGGKRGSGEARSQCDSQLEGVLSAHVKRLLAPLILTPAGECEWLQDRGEETDSTARRCQDRKWK